MTEAKTTVIANLVLSPEHDERLTAIAEHMTRRYGVSVSRSAAARRLIDLFFLSECSIEGSTDLQKSKAAA